ncbi:unnamed protein product [Rotaria sp. Silwood1]|nr:unnamed protein product [Rotaria sp. Silwood1]CAF4642207.1 unnamed protein product [Rotaria sp. Silwood1]
MPKFIFRSTTNDELYNEIKSLRSSKTNKRLRRLRTFERIYYKKTCEVTKTGHNLEDVHRLDDGNLRYTTHNLTYSLNKKKRWLLPDIIQERICEYDPTAQSSQVKKGDQVSNIDERLKIVMYENENIHHSSTCLRYSNNQTVPQILHKNGRRFNSKTLTRWINFDTRTRWHSHHRNHSDDRVNQPNFGIQQRPGFFPSEVTYTFLYPKRLPSSEIHKNGKTSLSYCRAHDVYEWPGRNMRDTNKNRRKIRRNECMKFGFDDYAYDFEEEEEDINTNEFILASSNFIDEDEKWSIVFEELDNQYSASIDLPIEYFIPSISSNCKSSSLSNDCSSDVNNDRKAHKYFEPWPISDKKITKPSIITEDLLCSIPCENESDFLSLMQQSALKIYQANLSPLIFLQRTSTSSFSVIYTYCRKSSTVEAVLKFTDLPPNITFNAKEITLEKLIELISNKLDENQIEQNNKLTNNTRIDVDALRGSLPLPLNITQQMILVRPKSTNKLTALKNENLINHNQKQQEQWYDTTDDEYEILECSICCDTLTTNDAYQLLPCHHTICHSCLKSYICTSISSATYSSSSTLPITCFQQNCTTQLNSSLLQAFVSYEIYQSYNQSLLDRHLFSTGNYRKCPSRICVNLLIVDDKTKSSLMCSCGQRVCSECLEEYHFPATCQQYKSYLTRLHESGDDLLSISKIGDNSHCYIAEGKNCPNCGEFVEKNGGCPHMTCKCGNEFCWMCLNRWVTHNYSTCFHVPESTHELRSSTRNRLHNKAVNHRRERNQFSFNLLSQSARALTIPSTAYNIILSTYIDLNTLAEFLYVLLQRRRTDTNIRAVLSRTAKRLELDAFQIKLQLQCKQIKMEYIEQMRLRLERTVSSLLHMKRNNILI